jgi:hypothetical protein
VAYLQQIQLIPVEGKPLLVDTLKARRKQLRLIAHPDHVMVVTYLAFPIWLLTVLSQACGEGLKDMATILFQYVDDVCDYLKNHMAEYNRPVGIGVGRWTVRG